MKPVATVIDPQKLRTHVDAGYRRLASLRAQRRSVQNEYAGRFSYGNDNKPRHLNLVNKTAQTFIRHIAFNAPEHQVETDFAELHGDASLLSMFLDRHARITNRAMVSRMVLQDAFFGPKGFGAVMLKGGTGLVKCSDKTNASGSIVYKRIGFNDYVCDPAHDDPSEIQWEGFFYAVNRASAIESGLFDPAIEGVPLMQAANCGSWSDDRLRDTWGGIPSDDRQALYDRIPLLDVFIYDDDQTWVVTLSGEIDGADDFLRVEQYNGPGRSPLIPLEFDPFGDHPHGVAPASQWMESADAFNTIVSKMVRQTDRIRNLLLSRRGLSEDELESVRSAPDGEHVEVDDPSAHASVSIGLVSPELPIMARFMQDAHNQSGNGADVLSGTAKGKPSATQYSGDLAQANAILEDYGNAHDAYESEVSSRVAFYGLHDPTFTMPVTFRHPGAAPVQLAYPPGVQRGDYEAFRFRIIPRSMERLDPAVKSMRTLQIVDVIMKGAQVAAATAMMAPGGLIDVTGLARQFGNESGMRGLEQVVRDPVLMMQAAQMRQALPPKQIGTPAGGVMPDRVMGAPGASAQARTAVQTEVA